MIIFPAIDIIGGKPVRLFKGDFSTAEQVADDALETAENFVKAGAQWIQVEIGGGIRTMQDIDYYANHNISRVILGSVALKNPELVRQAVKEFGSLIAVGIDAKHGFVATEGWTEGSDTHFIDLAKQMEQMGVETVIYTDISKDGTLSGPNVEQLVELNNAVSCNITASGGVTNIDDITTLRDKELYGAICGKSIYQGTLSLKDAIDVCK